VTPRTCCAIWPRASETDPGDNGVNDFESWKEKGVWYKKPYIWRQVNGTFYRMGREGLHDRDDRGGGQEKLLKTPSGKFEFRSASWRPMPQWIAEKTGRDPARLMFPIWEEPVHPGGGDLLPGHAQGGAARRGRGHNIPMVIAHLQPVMGGRGQAYHARSTPSRRASAASPTATVVRISSDVGVIEAIAVFRGRAPRHARAADGIRPLGRRSMVKGRADRTCGEARSTCPTGSPDSATTTQPRSPWPRPEGRNTNAEMGNGHRPRDLHRMPGLHHGLRDGEQPPAGRELAGRAVLFRKGTYPNLNLSWLPRPCMQCENPSCVSVCPTKATYKTRDGVVLVDWNKCIGCKYCMVACPYGVRFYMDEEAAGRA
jgi:ferredoxin